MKREILTGVYTAGLAFGAVSCEYTPDPTAPEYGVITAVKNHTFQQYKSVYGCEYDYDPLSGKFKDVCENRDKPAGRLTTRIITLTACRKENGKLVIANREYLKEHVEYPSDYPVISDGSTESNIACKTTIEVVAKDLGNTGMGSIVDLKQLQRIKPHHYAK